MCCLPVAERFGTRKSNSGGPPAVQPTALLRFAGKLGPPHRLTPFFLLTQPQLQDVVLACSCEPHFS
jgi:hypothetical protein